MQARQHAACAHQDWETVECGRALHFHTRLQLGGIMTVVRIVRVPLGLLQNQRRAAANPYRGE